VGQVYVLLWFDTEDYILPQSDDAAKRLAVFLTQQGISATFKVVGEKARTLQRRQRQDVIGALARHDIGYHSNTHSQHPTVAEYEATLDWDQGVEEFTRRERPGFDDVARIFGKTPVAYGQPGASWAPQAFPALHKWGVPVYLDAAGALRRLMVAQDTGGAISGPVRGDVFWGFGPDAEARAGAQRASGRYYLLWPKPAAALAANFRD